jgi:hypothetical protein
MSPVITTRPALATMVIGITAVTNTAIAKTPGSVRAAQATATERSEIKERMPLQASATPRLCLVRWMMLPSSSTGTPSVSSVQAALRAARF